MTPAGVLFHPDALHAMQGAIREAGGNEVFFVGRPGGGFVVGEVQVLARGHESAVPAVMSAIRAGEVVIHNHPSGVLTPSQADLDIAARGAASGIAFIIVDNGATQAYTVVEPHQKRVTEPVDERSIAQLLGPDGGVASRLAGYEHREQQVQMAELVARALNREQVVIAEAGTGTGKSLAYLLPAILFATKNRERVVISTNTINLQEQLVGKDLPFIRDQLGIAMTAVLLKGRSNYLCKRKTEFASSQPLLLNESSQSVLAPLIEWAQKTEGGSRSDLSFPVSDDLWAEVASDSDDCMRARSPFFNSCFFYRSRRDAAAADVIVVNHHLLMADLATRAATGDYTSTAVLPPYDRVIVDEAHNLEDVASSYFGTSVTGLGVRRNLGRLRSEGSEATGVLATLGELLSGEPEITECLGEASEAKLDLVEGVREQFQLISEHARGFLGVDDPGREGLKLRLTPEVLRHPAFAEGVVVACRDLTRHMGEYLLVLARVGRLIGRLENPGDVVASAMMRIDSVRARLSAACEAVAAFPTVAPGQCRWLEVRRLRSGEKAARLASAPLAIGDLLAEQFYGKVKTVVLTSATLTVGKRFEHFAARLGVDRVARDRVTTARFESPFDFARQASVLVPTDMPEPQQPSFAEAVRDAVAEAVVASRGRAFILFTSYRLLDRTFRGLEGRLKSAGLAAFRQGDAPRDLLIQRFRREPGSVLFAVDSFWEGVDVPGEALSLVVLVRLPFRVPTEPLQEARVEAIQRAGGDPFYDFSLPQAVIKFRQGFGRLIRTRTDRGAVLVLDPRVTTKRYGRLFLDSLPDVRVIARPRTEVMAELGRFFGEQPAQASVRVKAGEGAERSVG